MPCYDHRADEDDQIMRQEHSQMIINIEKLMKRSGRLTILLCEAITHISKEVMSKELKEWAIAHEAFDNNRNKGTT